MPTTYHRPRTLRQGRARAVAWAAVLLALWPTTAGAAPLPTGPGAWRDLGLGAIRGMTIGPIESSQAPGRGYGTEAYERTLDELAELGVNWVSITPFGRVWSLDAREVLLDFEAPTAQNREDVGRAIDQAHARGLRVLLVPHLFIETTGWRGEIDPGDETGWREFIDSYERFLLHWADVAGQHNADMLSIGVECKSWSGRFWDRWEGMIARVRRKTGALLTYSANWDEVESVSFWPLLDVVGINAFYPLAPSPSGNYRGGAHQVVTDVAAIAQSLQMPVLFVEVGYTTRPAAAVEPWIWPEDLPGVRVDEEEQARAYRAVLAEYTGPRWLAGLFIWREYADPDDVSQEPAFGFSPRAKHAEQELHDAFGWTWGADPPAPWVGTLPID